MNSDIKQYPIYERNGRGLFPLEKRYLEKLKEWRNTQMAILRQWKPLTDMDQEKWFERISERKDEVLFSILVSEEIGDERLIGYCGLVNIDYISRRGEVSFLVEPSRVSNRELYKDDFTAVLRMLCAYAFCQLNLNKIYTETYVFRKDHIHILEEFGFEKDGILREHQYKNGRYYDSVIHSVIRARYIAKYGEQSNVER